MRNRKTDFLGIHFSFVFFQFCSQHISEYCRCQTGCVGIYQEEQRVFAEYIGTQFDQRMNGFFDFPDFSLGSSSVRRRIHDDRIVMISSSYFPFYKFYTVIYQPANRRISQSGRDSIFFGPGNHTFGGIHMCDLSTGSSCCKCSTACIGKKIQDFYRSSGISDFF